MLKEMFEPYQEVFASVRQIIETVFQDQLVFGCINGRAAVGKAEKGKSDIDILVVVKNDITKDDFDDRWEEFIKFYKQIHLDNKFLPDELFPGDYLTENQLKDIELGRGWSVSASGRLMPSIIKHYEDESPETDFTIFRSMLNIAHFITGNEEVFQYAQSGATNSLIKLIFYERAGQVLQEHDIIQELIDDKVEGIYRKHGYSKLYGDNFSTVMHPRIVKSVEILQEQGLIQANGGGFSSTDLLEQWGEEVVDRIRRKQWLSTPLLVWRLPNGDLNNQYLSYRQFIFADKVTKANKFLL